MKDEKWGNLTLPDSDLSPEDLLRSDINRIIALRQARNDPSVRARRIERSHSQEANKKRKETMLGQNAGDKNGSKQPEAREKNRQSAMRRFEDPLSVPRMKYVTIGTNIETGEEIRLLGNRRMKEAGFEPSLIHHCITGRYTQHKGYTWRREPLDKSK